jgi:mono/diheme cytochrome c family protein
LSEPGVARAGVIAAFADAVGAATAALAPMPATTPPSAGRRTANDTSAYSPQGADTCLGCHNDASVTGIFRTKHARPE